MNDTSYNIPEAKAGRVVAAQQRDGERMDGKIVLQSPQPGLAVPMPIGGGGLTSTVDDYGRFVGRLLDGGALDGARVLKAENVALMGKNAIGEVCGCRRRCPGARRLRRVRAGGLSESRYGGIALIAAGASRRTLPVEPT
jgi:CubicO group peptidase (beta-lactamase class C family)